MSQECKEAESTAQKTTSSLISCIRDVLTCLHKIAHDLLDYPREVAFVPPPAMGYVVTVSGFINDCITLFSVCVVPYWRDHQRCVGGNLQGATLRNTAVLVS